MHLYAFVDYVNIFITYRSKQSTSELSLMVTEMVSTTVFFPIKKPLLRNKNLDKFCRCYSKTTLCILFKLNTGFVSCSTFFNRDSLHVRLNTHYKAWSCEKKKHKKIKAYREYLFRKDPQLIGVC